MFSFVIAFFIGDLYLQTYSQLPAKTFIISLLLSNGLFWIFLRNKKWYFHLPIAFLLGFAWTAWYANSLLSWSLPKAQEGRPILVTGYISSLPETENGVIHFLFSLHQWKNGSAIQNVKTRVRLSYRLVNSVSDPVFRVGDQRQFLVRMKRIHGTQNPGAFDFEAWALQSGLRAQGYVVANPNNILLSHDWYRYPIDQLRQMLQERIKNHLPNSRTAPWLTALIIGERNDIAAEDWQVLRNTGTNHLMAIAGLHIGIMAGFALSIISWLWRRVPFLVLRLPAPQAGASAALLVAILYSALAGFSLPTQRACIMLAVFIFAMLSRRKIKSWHSWSFAMLFVLMLNPLSVLTESFWLSFSTIALIIYGMSGRLAPSGFWWKWGRVQWVIGVGLVPVTLSLFQQCSLVSFLANSIAIPWLGFFILPFCFLSGIFLFFSPTIGGFFLFIADKSLSALWTLLAWFSQLHFSSWQQAMPNHGVLCLVMIGILLLLIPAGFPGRWLGLIWMLPLVFYKPIKPAPGDFWLSLLDVGQGLSVIVQTKNHLLVYDAGPKFSLNFDMGESVVLPYLYTINRKQIDMLVVSHGDNDHIGGTQALLKSLLVISLKTSVPERFQSNAYHRDQVDISYCLAGYRWQWDQVDFTFVYPTPDDLEFGNDSSCVLRIDNGEQSVLLTGDIEKYAEINLLKRVAGKLAATILVAPHHGSKTSGLASFLTAVHPKFVFYATGYRNRYHFPHPSVMATYKQMNAQQWNTAETGMIFVKLEKGKALSRAELYRVSNKHYWYDSANERD